MTAYSQNDPGADKRSLDPKGRFTDRVEDYARYRPGYPVEVIHHLREATGLAPEHVIADVGSGTGLLSRLFLGNGNLVYGVEPNDAMRSEAERVLEAHPDFVSVKGSAENLPLPDSSADYIAAGQAFHWFELAPARREFIRVLRPDGWVVLVWNDRDVSASPLMRGYEDLLQEVAEEYPRLRHQSEEEIGLDRLFDRYTRASFPHHQDFDLEGLTGRLLSSSYAPRSGHRHYKPMIDALKTLFQQNEVDGRVRFVYTTEVFLGQL